MNNETKKEKKIELRNNQSSKPIEHLADKIGENVKRIRQKIGMTQEELANIADIDVAYLSRIENGQRNPSLKAIHKLANALNIAPEKFFLEFKNRKTTDLADLLKKENLTGDAHSKVASIIIELIALEGLNISDEQVGPKLVEVLHELFLRPLSFKGLVYSLNGREKEQMRQLYALIGKSKCLQDLLAHYSPDSLFVETMQKMRKDTSFLNSFLKGEPVFPRILEFRLGDASCSLYCKSCYVREEIAQNNRLKEAPSLTVEKVKSVVKSFAQKGGKILHLSGGGKEYVDPISTIQAGAEENLNVYLYTNGVPEWLNADENRRLVLAHVEKVNICVHSETKSLPEFDEALLRRIESTIRVRNAISSRSRIGIVILATPENCRKLEKIIRLWQSVGVDFLSIRTDFLDTENLLESRNEWEEIVRTFEKIRTYQHLGLYEPLSVELNQCPLEESYSVALPTTCYSPLYKIVVDYQGKVWCCPMGAIPINQHPRYELGRLSKESLDEIIEKSQSFTPFPHCSRCTTYERILNTCLEEVMDVHKNGFEVEDLPFSLDIRG